MEYLQEEFLLQGSPAGDGRGPCGAGEHGQQGDDQHAGQGVSLVDGRAWVFQLLKVSDDLVQNDPPMIGHASPPGVAVMRATPGKVHKRGSGRKHYSLPGLPISARWPWGWMGASRRSSAPRCPHGRPPRQSREPPGEVTVEARPQPSSVLRPAPAGITRSTPSPTSRTSCVDCPQRRPGCSTPCCPRSGSPTTPPRDGRRLLELVGRRSRRFGICQMKRCAAFVARLGGVP
jgi:hypothetical protein